MSDQAILTFRAYAREVDAYVHDMTGLDDRLRDWAEWVLPSTAKAWARKLRVVDPSSRPTEADQVSLLRYADLGVSSGALTDWYCLLRRTQGDPDRILRAGIVVRCDLGARPFARWRYVLDLDTPSLVLERRPGWMGGVPDPFHAVATIPWVEIPATDLALIREAAELLEDAEAYRE